MIHSFIYCLERGNGWGQVTHLSELIVKAKSLEGVKIGEGVVFEGGERGRVMMVARDGVKILRLTGKPVAVGERVASTGLPLLVSCGEGYLGKVVNGLGYAIGLGREKSIETETRIVEATPLGISERARVTRFAETGVTVLDAVIPMGKGQRELLIGERKSGKTELALNILATEIRAGAIGIYALIGKRGSEVGGIVSQLKDRGVIDKCIVVASEASTPAGEIFMTPYTAMAIAEYFRDQGKDTIIILDDLSTHAKYYREIGLSAGQFPGRESYPGDIFYTHARLLERAGNFCVGKKEVAITAVPIAETSGGELSGYITTNLMSITDGHWYLDGEMFLSGIRPAVNLFLSVTRVGRQTQPKSLRILGEELLRALKAEAEVSRFVKFGTELTPQAQIVAGRGMRIRRLLNQESGNLRPWELSLYLMTLVWDRDVTEMEITRTEKHYFSNSAWRKKLSDWIAMDGGWDGLRAKAPREGAGT